MNGPPEAAASAIPIHHWDPLEVPDFLGVPPDARHDVIDPRGALLPLHALVLRRPPSTTLVVHLHGALDRQKYRLPRFERLATFRDLPHHQLFLSDPTLQLDPLLRLGWYVGAQEENSTDRLAVLVREVARQLEVERIILEGASGGGFGALAMAPRLPGSLALAFSPQANLGRFSNGAPANSLVRTAFPGYRDHEQLEAAEPARVDLTALYDRLPGGRGWYIQNSGDEPHVQLQMNPFRERVDDRVTFVEEHHCMGHNPPTPHRVRAWVEFACEHYHDDPRPFRLADPG